MCSKHKQSSLATHGSHQGDVPGWSPGLLYSVSRSDQQFVTNVFFQLLLWFLQFLAVGETSSLQRDAYIFNSLTGKPRIWLSNWQCSISPSWGEGDLRHFARCVSDNLSYFFPCCCFAANNYFSGTYTTISQTHDFVFLFVLLCIYVCMYIMYIYMYVYIYTYVTPPLFF